MLKQPTILSLSIMIQSEIIHINQPTIILKSYLCLISIIMQSLTKLSTLVGAKTPPKSVVPYLVLNGHVDMHMFNIPLT